MILELPEEISGRIHAQGESAYPEELAKPVKNGDKLHVIFLIGGG